MSGGYASRLSHYPNKGVVGLPEIYDTDRTLTVKIKRLTAEIQSSTNIVILTGAGISTAAKIPDFRGPNGFWTKEKLQQQQQHYKSKSSTFFVLIPLPLVSENPFLDVSNILNCVIMATMNGALSANI